MDELALSILVPAITERSEARDKLLDELQRQVDAKDYPVEILCFIDNRKRTIGEKRDDLVQLARGRYVAFVDDDDWVAPEYVEEILMWAGEGGPDVISFINETTINGENPFKVHMKLENTEHEGARQIDGNWMDINRPPWHTCAWRRELAQQFRFPATNYGEDWGWVSQFVGRATSEYHITKVLHYYRYDDDVTRAT